MSAFVDVYDNFLQSKWKKFEAYVIKNSDRNVNKILPKRSDGYLEGWVQRLRRLGQRLRRLGTNIKKAGYRDWEG